MHQIAFYIGSKAIHWYGVCIALGFVAAVMILLWKREHARMTKDQIFDLSMIALFTGLVGGRLFYVVQFWDRYFAGHSFWRIFRIDEGGLVFYGGFIVAFTAVCIYAKVKKLSIARILDIFGPAMALSHAFGRIGCFLQGCCFGRPWAKGVVYPEGSAPAYAFPDLATGCSLPLYPVQLFESGLNVLLCIFLLTMLRFCRKSGQVAALYIIFYAVLRFSLEFLRGDHTNTTVLTTSQIIALCIMLPVGIGLFIYWSSLKEKAPELQKPGKQNVK